MIRFILFVVLPLLITSAWFIHELRLYRREVAWQKRRRQVDALRAALLYRAAEKDREAAEREAFDRKLKGEEDDDDE